MSGFGMVNRLVLAIQKPEKNVWFLNGLLA
jgi:hypothetical protein